MASPTFLRMEIHQWQLDDIAYSSQVSTSSSSDSGASSASEDMYLASPTESACSSFETTSSQKAYDNKTHTLPQKPYTPSLSEDMMANPSTTMDPATSDLAPALPARSGLRRPRATQLKKDDEVFLASQPVQLERYQSSEEDASSSADNFSDFELDSDIESEDGEHGSALPPSPCKNHHGTARQISVIFSGKPIMVNLPSRPRSMSPKSAPLLPPINSLRRVPRELFHENRASISSVASTPAFFGLASRTGSTTSLATMSGERRPGFLDTDPFAMSAKTITPPSFSGASSSKGFRRTFSLVKKRSRPTLTSSASLQTPDSPTSPKSTVYDAGQIKREDQKMTSLVSQRSISDVTSGTTASYQDIIKAARRNARIHGLPAISTSASNKPTSLTSGTKGFVNGLSFSLRKNMKS